MGHPRTFGCWSRLIHRSHLFRSERAAACPQGEDALHGGRLGTGTCSATCHVEASELSIQAPSILRASGCTELPGGGYSARGEDARQHHLIVLSSGSHHGDGCHRHHVALPRAPAEGRGASPASQGFSLGFQESAEAEDNSSPGWKDLVGLGTLTFSSSSSSRPRYRRPPAPGALQRRCSD